MFALTHIYCTKKIIKNASPLLLYGSLFPDIPVTGIVSWNEMKIQTEKFSDYIKDNCPDLIDFSEGLLLHEEPKGIDRFVHGDRGYAYVKGKKILKQFERYFPDNPSDAAHSFVEFAVEMLLAENTPNLQKELKLALKSAQESLNLISELLSKFFGLDKDKTTVAIKEFNDFLLKMDLSSRNKSIKFYTFLTNKIRKTDYSEDIIENLLEKAIETVKQDYLIFLEDSISKCKNRI